MIVNIRLEVSDEQRNALAVQNNGGVATKRLATRAEFNALVADFVSKLGVDSAPVEKRDPEPLEAAKPAIKHPFADAPPAPPEDMPVPTSDRTPVSCALEAVNNAVFALQIAKRFYPADNAIQQAVLHLADARDQAVDAYERLS